METFHDKTPDELRKLSSDYVSMANNLQTGSPVQMRILEKALRINPKNEAAHISLSYPYLYRGLYDEWNYHSSKVIELNPKAWQGWRGYHKLYFFRDYGGALFDLDATDTLTLNQRDYTNNKSVDFMRGLCYIGLDNFPRAKEYFWKYINEEKQVIEEQYVDEMAYMHLATISNKEHDYAEALSLLDRAMKYEDGNADIYYQKAIAHFYQREIQMAIAAITKAKAVFERGEYNKGYLYETIDQIYLTDITELEKEIKCFL